MPLAGRIKLVRSKMFKNDTIGELTKIWKYEIFGGAQIELPHLGKLCLVREAAAQSAAEQPIEGELVIVPAIREPTRCAYQRRMIENYVMPIDGREPRRREVVLPGGDAYVFFSRNEQVCADGEILRDCKSASFRCRRRNRERS